MPKPPADALHAAIRLRSAVSALTRTLRGQASDDGPGAAKLSALGHLYRSGPLTPTEIAQLERVKLQTLTRLLAELVAAGWVRREAHDSDARKSVLSLTSSGVRMLTAEVHRREGSLAQALASRLDADQRATLVAACELIDSVTEAMADIDPAAPASAAARRGTPS